MKKTLLYILWLVSFCLVLVWNHAQAATCWGWWQCPWWYSLTWDTEPDGTPNCIENVCTRTGWSSPFIPVVITNWGWRPDYTIDPRVPSSVTLTADIDCTYTPSGNITYQLDTSDNVNCWTVLGWAPTCTAWDIDLWSYPNLSCTAAYNITVSSWTITATDGYLYTWNPWNNTYDPVPVCLNQNATCPSCQTEPPVVCDINDPGLAWICYIPDYYWTTLNVANWLVWVNTPSPAYPLDVDGTVRAGGLYLLSDMRIKTSISKIDQSLEKIRAINWYSFTWKDTGKADLWVLAQEIEKVFADAVATDKNWRKSVQYAALIAPILEALDELSTQIDSMATEKYKAQSNRLDAIEMRIK